MIDVSKVTSTRLRQGYYKTQFLDYYALMGVVENGMWHDQQDVFDHVTAVYEALETELSFSELPETSAQHVRNYLGQKVGNRTRLELVRIATLLHDIAKADTLIVHDNGTANCPGHEHIAAARVKRYAGLFDMNELDTYTVTQIVLHHGFISEILMQVVAKPEKEGFFWNIFVETVETVAYELLLLMRADLHGCDLEKSNPNLYAQYDALLLQWLKEHAPEKL